MGSLDRFTRLARTAYTVREIGDHSVTISAETLPRAVEVWVPEFKAE